MAMINYLEMWARDLLSGRSLRLLTSIQVEGVCDRHLGPRIEYAWLALLIEPADTFEFLIRIGESDEGILQHGYLDYAVLGLLDVLMVTDPYPLKNVRVVVTGAKYDPINSSQVAFRR